MLQFVYQRVKLHHSHSHFDHKIFIGTAFKKLLRKICFSVAHLSHKLVFCDLSPPWCHKHYVPVFYSVDLEYLRIPWWTLWQIITICNWFHFERKPPVPIRGHQSPGTRATPSSPIHYILRSSTTVMIIYCTNHWALWIYGPDQKPTLNIKRARSVWL